MGQPMEHVLRQCLLALRLAERLGLDDDGARSSTTPRCWPGWAATSTPTNRPSGSATTWRSRPTSAGWTSRHAGAERGVHRAPPRRRSAAGRAGAARRRFPRPADDASRRRRCSRTTGGPPTIWLSARAGPGGARQRRARPSSAGTARATRRRQGRADPADLAAGQSRRCGRRSSIGPGASMPPSRWPAERSGTQFDPGAGGAVLPRPGDCSPSSTR